MGPYLADFCCVERRLIVELDGSVHGQPSQARKDTKRDAHLRILGYTVLRLPNGIVLQAPELFVQKVLSVVWSVPEALVEHSRIVTPSTGPPPLVKARVAGHPLPQGGEG